MRAVIFDLDGTLTRSEEGIWKCAVHTARTLGYPEPGPDALRSFIGPPIAWSFRNLLGMREEDVPRAITVYRERYQRVGLFENRVYPGIRNLLRMLKRRGDYVAVATGKPQSPSERIVRHFGLEPFIDRIVGAGDEAGAEKEPLIRAALPENFDEAWMVGDRRYDVEGGLAVGIRTAGAGWGYGSEEELRGAGCEAYAPTVRALTALLCPGEEIPQGAFVSMEGGDGSGKGTQIELLADALDRWGYEVERGREPGGTPIGEKIRAVILDRANTGMTGVTEALLYAASRAQYVRERVRPAVADGRVFLSDRFVDSSVAYQGGGRELGVDRITEINAAAVDGTLPLVTVYLDIDHREAMRRRRAASVPDRLEAEPDSFHARVEEAYRELIRRDPGRFAVVDAAGTREEVAARVAEAVLGRLAEAER